MEMMPLLAVGAGIRVIGLAILIAAFVIGGILFVDRVFFSGKKTK